MLLILATINAGATSTPLRVFHYMNFTEIAEEFLMEGLNPLPLKENKAPKLAVGHPYLYEKIINIDYHFKNCEKIGIACGDVSGGFYCLDFDKHQGQDIKPIVNLFMADKFVKQLFKEKKLTLYKTPSGGAHIYFRCNHTYGGKVLAQWDDDKTMIEIRGNGQYIACYPSEGYTKVKGCDILEINFIEENQENYLLKLALSLNKGKKKINEKTTGKKWPDKWDDDKPIGKFNNGNGEDVAKQLLIDAGWQFVEIRRDGVETWTRPGKDIKSGISATWGKFNKMFYVFSQNATPFAGGSAYSPFDVFLILKHNNNFASALNEITIKPIKFDTSEDSVNVDTKFPIEIFPDFYKNYILELKRTLNFHIDFSAAALMFSFATINGNKYKLRVKQGWESPTIFWFACVGYPGTIKTHPIKTIIKPIIDIDKNSKLIYDREVQEWEQEDENKPKPRFKQVIITDYTVEALHHVHNINKRGIGLYRDELRGFIGDMNKYRKGSDEEFWLESFNNNSYIVNRVTKEPIMVSDININIIGTIQHDVLGRIVAENKGNGLIDRFLFTSAENTVYNINDNNISDFYYQTWSNLIQSMNDNFSYNPSIGDGTIVLDMDKETFEVYRLIDASYCEIQNSENESQEIKNYLSKMKTYVPRFALILAIIESTTMNGELIVNKQHMINAGKLAEYFINTAKGVFDRHESLSDIKSVEQSLKGLKLSDKVIELAKKDFKPVDLAKYFGKSKQYIYKILREYNEKSKQK